MYSEVARISEDKPHDKITPTKRSNTSPPVHIVKSIRLLHGEGLDDA